MTNDFATVEATPDTEESKSAMQNAAQQYGSLPDKFLILICVTVPSKVIGNRFCVPPYSFDLERISVQSPSGTLDGRSAPAAGELFHSVIVTRYLRKREAG